MAGFVKVRIKYNPQVKENIKRNCKEDKVNKLVKNLLKSKLNSICIIPAREAVKFQKKNKKFLGKPVISYVIKIAKQSKLFDQVILVLITKILQKSQLKMGQKYIGEIRNFLKIRQVSQMLFWM